MGHSFIVLQFLRFYLNPRGNTSLIYMKTGNTPHGVIMAEVVFYGADWCRDCVRSKRLLEENSIPFEYRNIVNNPEFADKVVQLNIGAGFGPKRRIPTIVIDEKVLSVPTDIELATALGLPVK